MRYCCCVRVGPIGRPGNPGPPGPTFRGPPGETGFQGAVGPRGFIGALRCTYCVTYFILTSCQLSQRRNRNNTEGKFNCC